MGLADLLSSFFAEVHAEAPEEDETPTDTPSTDEDSKEEGEGEGEEKEEEPEEEEEEEEEEPEDIKPKLEEGKIRCTALFAIDWRGMLCIAEQTSSPWAWIVEC